MKAFKEYPTGTVYDTNIGVLSLGLVICF